MREENVNMQSITSRRKAEFNTYINIRMYVVTVKLLISLILKYPKCSATYRNSP